MDINLAPVIHGIWAQVWETAKDTVVEPTGQGFPYQGVELIRSARVFHEERVLTKMRKHTEFSMY